MDDTPQPGPPFTTDATAAEFYGLRWRTWMELKKLGKQMSDPLPADSPVDMPGWFDRMRTAGRRKHKTPQSILDRAAECGGPSQPVTPKPARKAKASPPKPAQPAPEPVTPPPSPNIAPMTDSATANDHIEMFYRRELSRLQTQYGKDLRDGNVQAARNTKAEFQAAAETLRKWEKDKKQIRAGEDWMQRDKVATAAQQAMAGVWRAVNRALLAEFPGEDHPRINRAMSGVERRLQQFIPEEIRPKAA